MDWRLGLANACVVCGAVAQALSVATQTMAPNSWLVRLRVFLVVMLSSNSISKNNI
jgi:hypothetical protein